MISFPRLPLLFACMGWSIVFLAFALGGCGQKPQTEPESLAPSAVAQEAKISIDQQIQKIQNDARIPNDRKQQMIAELQQQQKNAEAMAAQQAKK